MEISTPRQLLRSLGPLPETSARTPPKLREVPPGAFPGARLAGRLSYLNAVRGERFRETNSTNPKKAAGNIFGGGGGIPRGLRPTCHISRAS